MDEFKNDIAAVARIDSVPTILDVVCRTTGMGFAAVTRVTDEHWVACGLKDEIGFGLAPGDNLQIDTTICRDVRASGRPVVIEDAPSDPRYSTHPGPPLHGFRSQISVPIVLPDGRFFGTLCAVDRRPARLDNPETVGMLTMFADLIGFQLEAQERLAASEAAMVQGRRDAEERERFIAVLGHDLRNPLAAIDAGVKLLGSGPLDARAASVVSLMQNSVDRMAGLIDTVLDFARGRLGGGLALERDTDQPLGPVLEQVVAELRAAWPERWIAARIMVHDDVTCDRARIAQLLSNLLANALAHGAADRPVAVSAITEKDRFELSVTNGGDPIPPDTMAALFQPFVRSAVRSGKGLGLGLYIASEIARAHGGTLDVSSTAEETRFTFRMSRLGSAASAMS